MSFSFLRFTLTRDLPSLLLATCYIFAIIHSFSWIETIITWEMPEDEEDDECGIVFLAAAEIHIIETQSFHVMSMLKSHVNM